MVAKPIPVPVRFNEPVPCPPAPPRSGESAADYDRRCGPFVRVGTALLHWRLAAWYRRQGLVPCCPDNPAHAWFCRHCGKTID